MIVVVSGLPRSGTSMMMQMLAAGGLSPLTDDRRPPDVSNPRGYFEWERAKSIVRDPLCIAQAEGRAVKVASMLLPSLPRQFSYKVVLMQRCLTDVVASQAAMTRRLGTQGAGLTPEAMARALELHLRNVEASLRPLPELALFRLEYSDVLAEPRFAAERVQVFLGVPLNVGAMASQVDPSLNHYRSHTERGGPGCGGFASSACCRRVRAGEPER